ncbi:hypothetical protein JCM8208_005987 [Rhodotorula glutinis]
MSTNPCCSSTRHIYDAPHALHLRQAWSASRSTSLRLAPPLDALCADTVVAADCHESREPRLDASSSSPSLTNDGDDPLDVRDSSSSSPSHERPSSASPYSLPLPTSSSSDVADHADLSACPSHPSSSSASSPTARGTPPGNSVPRPSSRDPSSCASTTSLVDVVRGSTAGEMDGERGSAARC